MPSYSSIVTSVKEGFSNPTTTTNDMNGLLVGLLVVLVLIVIQLFVIQFLWNRVLTNVIPAVKPLRTLLDTLGILILLLMLFPGCV
jgi:hypothetical protein